MTDILLYALMLLLIALSALFSGSEIAFAQVNAGRLKKNAEGGDRRSRIAEYIAEHYTHSLSTILIGNNLVNIAATSTLTMLFVDYFGRTKGPTLAGLVATVVILIFGEILPKIIASEYADSIVLIVAHPLRFFMFVFAPVVHTVSALIGKLEKLWTKDDDQRIATQEELVNILETIEEEGVFTEKEGELIKSALEFPDVTARDILIPRVDVAAYDIENGSEHIFDDSELLSYSRFPVYRDSLDDIIGIMPTKQLMKTTITDPDCDVFTLLTPPVYVHMTRPISSILMEFRKTHSHMAVVVDEFGGMMGILTLEDILEELFGEIYDESDEVEDEEIAEQTSDGVYEVDGTMNVYDMFELTGFDGKDFNSEYTTVGGWTTEMLDRFPVPGDCFEYAEGNKLMKVTVLEAEAVRVVKLRIEVSETDEDEED